MFAFRDKINKGVNIKGRLTKRMRCDLPMDDLRGDIGAIRRDLSPPDVASVCRHLHKANKFGGEGLDLGNFHERQFQGCVKR